MSAYRIKVDLVRIHRHFRLDPELHYPGGRVDQRSSGNRGKGYVRGAAGSIAIWLLRVVQPKEADGLGSTVDANDTRERVSVTHPAAAHRSALHVNLAGLFRISPIVGLKNFYTRLQEGKVIALGN